MTSAAKDNPPTFEDYMSGSRNWMMATGIVMILAGAGAIIFPMISSFGVVICIAILLIIAGVTQIIHAFSYPKWGRFLLVSLVGVVWLLAGLALFARPVEGIFVLTLVVAAAFLAEGILKTIFAFRMRPSRGWGWLLFNGIVAMAVGLLLWSQLPSSALWALGLLAGINIMISGWTLVMLASTVRKFMQLSAEKPRAA